MRKPLLVAGMTLLCLSLFSPFTSNAQLLNWLSSYVPAWTSGNTSGTATNIGSTGVNCTTAVTISGGAFTQALGSSGSMTPTVSGATFTVPSSTNRMQVTTNFATNANYCNIVMTFSTFVTNVSFKIVDIDKSDANSTTYFDRVTITASNGSSTFNATLTKYDASTDPNFLIITGNAANVNTTSGQAGNTDSDGSDQRGTINVSFGSLGLKTVTIRYDNAAGTDANPAAQAIGIGSLSFVPSSTLPLTLSSFAGSQKENDVLLKWTTAQEINTASFILERKPGDNNWQTIATIAARGNSTQLVSYSYTDISPSKTILLYRLKQVDIDGNYKYSSIVKIINKDNSAEMSVYPNPFTSQINVSVYSAIDQKAKMRITDASGKWVRTSDHSLYKGNNNFSVDALNKLPKGVYVLQIIGDDRNAVGNVRLIKN